MPKSNKKLTALYGKHLTKAVEEGYGQKIGGIDYDTPDGNMLKHLLQNVYQFSAAKNHTQLRQLTQALIGEDGKLRTYNQFKKAAYEINDTHTNQWLKAEYELAVAGSQMASKWVDINSNKGTNILEFDAVLDSKTSDGCRSLNGVRKPIDDPLWDIYYPPNHFGPCRSTVRQHFDGGTTPDHSITYPDDKKVPPMFRVNLAKQKLVFPAGHSYWSGTPVEILQEALEMAPINSWVIVEDGAVRIHTKVDTQASDFNQVMEVARDFANKGSKVDVMPTFDDAADPLYKKLFLNAKPGKQPDLFIDGKFVEVKAPKSNSLNALKRNIDTASKQADHVVIINPERSSWKELKRIAKGRFLDHSNLKVIEFKQDGAYYRFIRETYIK